MTLSTMMLMAMTLMTWLMLSSNNSMTLSLMTTCTATMSSLTLSLMLSSWYALILFLIYVGGTLIMFSYFTGLSSNEPSNMKKLVHFIVIPVIIMKYLYMQNNMPIYNNSQMNLMYKSSNIITTLLITMILLMVMIIVIKVVKMNSGPFRGFYQL